VTTNVTTPQYPSTTFQDRSNKNAKNFSARITGNGCLLRLRGGERKEFQISGRDVLSQKDGTPEQIKYAVVTTNFFRLIGFNQVSSGARSWEYALQPRGYNCITPLLG
jgi:hypothetical protein